MQDVRRFNQNFYADSDKIKQDNIILKYCTAKTPQRSRSNNVKNSVAIKYFVKRRRQASGTSLVQVCQQSFVFILDISKDRVQRVNRTHMKTGRSPKENRGGNRKVKKFKDKHNAVKKFIEKFEPLESHYGRNKSVRQYLSSDLSVRKMWRAYNIEHNADLAVKYEYFQSIFVKEFNISFGTPATDARSTCISYQERIKAATDPHEKEKLRAEYHVHKLKAKAFYVMLKTDHAGSFVLSFDCQKNLVLPKVPDQIAYYCRQVYSYNLTICQGSSKSPQNKDTVFIYNWLESEFCKSSNEIVSAVYHRLNSSNLEGFDNVKLFADGAGGQNKNSTMLTMLAYWLGNKSPVNIKEVHITFPIVGHSFLPSDRVFGRIEQALRKKDTIIRPEEYVEIFSTAGTVFQVGHADCKVLNWKAAATENMKAPGQLHFQFQPCKQFSLKKSKAGKILLRGEVNYRSDLGAFKEFSKKNKSFSFDLPAEIEKGSCEIKNTKIVDVDKLLKAHFGALWKENPDLKFYKELLEKQPPLVQQTAKSKAPVEVMSEEDELFYDEDEVTELRI